MPNLTAFSTLTILIGIIAITTVPFAVASSTHTVLHGAGRLPNAWSRTYVPIIGGPGSIQVTSDFGFVVVGRSADAWVMRASSSGEPEWEKEYVPAGYTNAQAASVQQTRDHGYIVSGYALSLGYVTSYDAWLLKLDRKGDVEWSKTYGGREGDGFGPVAPTLDGGYVVVGNTESFGSPLHASNGWVLKVDSEGRIVWQETFDGQDISSVESTRDGGFILAGTVCVCNATVNVAAAWLVKLNSEGKVVWQKAYENESNSFGIAVQETLDRGYVLAAELKRGFLSSETLLVRVDQNGDILWQRLFDGGGFTHPDSIVKTFDGGVVVAGTFREDNFGHGVDGPWLLKLDSMGNAVWQNTYGAINDDFFQVQETKDRGLIVAGDHVTYCCGDQAWVLRMDGSGRIGNCQIVHPSNASVTAGSAVTAFPNATSENTISIPADRAVITMSPPPTLHTLCLVDQNRKPKKPLP